MEEKVTAASLTTRKGKEKIVMVTATDEPTGRLVDRAGVDVVLVGDSLAMAVLGRPNTLSLTVEEMVHHTRAVAAGVRRALLVADMPFGSFQVSVGETVRNACRLVGEAGAEAVKLEGARVEEVRALVRAGIPVMGHVGLTPQSLHLFGGYRVQGKSLTAAQNLVSQARALEEAGVFALVVEGVPPSVGKAITAAVGIPTIGIGAGPSCDGQVLVLADLLGLSARPAPRFVRRYADLADTICQAVARFAADVREGSFPTVQECYPDPPEVAAWAAGEV
ncbi:MAG: 3-methyl-2-oxobutanoate hydroxymethyltransferase [Thermoanaerobaculum sp.]|nr:3-methyl-2-oxobutanoate hydroxymethyltransferase [Thermoanaerobaculum sp.]MDW7967182.1 3-methyl-2-oxobutanoate hydroxymethyltransferase [Thermoanaerobaculum sp.]